MQQQQLAVAAKNPEKEKQTKNKFNPTPEI